MPYKRMAGICDPTSHPSRVRGLKYQDGAAPGALRRVAPFTGAWIEIGIAFDMSRNQNGRTLHGCVD